MTILRYAHAFADGGGGVEQHLEHLDRALLHRRPWTIIRILLSAEGSQFREESTMVGQGRLIRAMVPVSGSKVPSILREDSHAAEGGWLRDAVRDHLICNPLLWRVWGRKFVLRRNIPRRAGEPAGIDSIASDLIARYNVTLVMLHFQGGADAEDVIRAAQAKGVPIGIENHFANDRFHHLSMRKHALLADGVAGVNGLQVPRYLKKRFVNLSNGIDTDFFAQASATGEPIQASAPAIILLPARIVRNKGHLDLISAAKRLAEQKLAFEVHFAGREEPGPFADQLRTAISLAGLETKTRFLGGLSQVQLRDAYQNASLVALPTYHHEGLPRVLVEAQAVALPVIAYDIGGVAEALQPDATGFLLKVGDVAGLAERLGQLLRDPLLRARMGQAGRKFVEERFSLFALAERHESFYDKVLKTARPRLSS